MAITYQSAGALAYNTTANVAVPYPASIAAGDYLVLLVGQKPDTAGVTTPSGWTLLNTTAGGAGTTGADTGPTRISAYGIIAAGGETGNLSVAHTGNNVAWGQMLRLTKTTGSWDAFSAGGVDSTTGAAWSASITAANGAVAANDFLVVGAANPTDVDAQPQFTAQAVSATGLTMGTMTAVSEPESLANNDIGGFVFVQPVSSGSNSSNLTVSATRGGTTTNISGPTVVIRLRETSSAVTPTGLPSAEAFGTAVITAVLLSVPTAIVTGEAFGATVITGVLVSTPTAISTGQAFGTPAITAGTLTASPAGLATGEAFGTLAITGLLGVAPSSIVTAEALGSPFIFVNTRVGNKVYPSAAEGFLSGALDWDTAVIRVALVRYYTYNPAHRTVADVEDSGGIFYRTSDPLTGKTVTNGTANADDVTIAPVAANGSQHYLIVMQTSPPEGGPELAEAEQRLIAWVDTATNLPISPDGTPVKITWDNGPLGIFSLWRDAPYVPNSVAALPIGISSSEAFGLAAVSGLLTASTVGIVSAAAVGTPAVTTTATAAPTFVGQVAGNASSTGLTLTRSVAAGRLAIVSSSTPGNATIADTGGNTWVEVADTLDVGAADQRKGQTWIAFTNASFTAVTISGASGSYAGNLSEWSGAAALVDSAVSTGLGGTNTVEAVVNDFIFVTNYRFGTVAETPPAGYTGLTFALQGNFANSTAYKFVTAAGSETVAFGTGNAGRIAAVIRGVLAGINTSPFGIESGAAFGAPTVSYFSQVVPTGIASAEAFGAPIVPSNNQTASPTGIASLNTLGTPAITGGGSQPAVILQSYTDGQTLARAGGYSVEIHNVSNSYCCQVATNRTSLEYFEVRSGDLWHGLSTERSEFSGPSGIAYGSDIWLSFNFMVLPGTTYTTWNVMGQLHGTSGTSPIFVQELQGSTFTIKTRHDRNGAGVYTTTNRYSFSLVRGQKYNIVHHLNISKTGNGLLQTWIDGVKVVDVVAPIGYNLTGTPYWKHGVYRSQATPAIRVRWANFEIKTDGTSLLSRVTSPLADPDPS